MDQRSLCVNVQQVGAAPGPYYFGTRGPATWSSGGSIRIGECKSPQLRVEGNAANARYLAKGTELPREVRRAEAALRGQGVQSRLIGTPVEQALHDLQRACAELGEAA